MDIILEIFLNKIHEIVKVFIGVFIISLRNHISLSKADICTILWIEDFTHLHQTKN